MSSGSGDLHSAPPLLFHDMPSPHYDRADPSSQSLFSSPHDFLPHRQALASPHDWAMYDHALGFQASMSLQFNTYPTSAPYPAPRLTPPPPLAPAPPQSMPTSVSSQSGTPRLTLAGSLDPTTGIFYRTPEHPRLRTAQACEKCRTRKAKCSGEHPSCKRCQNRGLVCEYAKEGRVRGPNKPKNGKVSSTPADEPRNFPYRSLPGHNGRASEPADLSQAMLHALREHDKRLALAGASPISRRGSLSMDEHRSNRPRPPNLKLDPLDGHFSQPDVFQIPHHDLRFTSGIHTAPPIPISYPGIHMPSGRDNLAYAYEESRSPSTSSSTSMQGCSQPMMHVQNTYFQGMQQRGSATNSPPALAYPTPVDVVSPSPTAASSMMHYGGGGGGFDADVKSPVPVHSPGAHPNMAHIDAALVSLSMDPQAWVGMGMKPEFVDVGFGHGAEEGQQRPVARDGAIYPLDMQMR